MFIFKCHFKTIFIHLTQHNKGQMGKENWRREIDWIDPHIIRCFHKWPPLLGYWWWRTMQKEEECYREECFLTWSPDSRWPYHLMGKVEAFDLWRPLFTVDPSTSSKSFQFSTSMAKNKACTKLFPASILVSVFILFSVLTSLFVFQPKDFTSHCVTSLLFIVPSKKTCLVASSENEKGCTKKQNKQKRENIYV